MQDITKNEMQAVLAIVKSPEIMYNANSLSKVLGISSMGALKIVKRLEKEGVLKSKQIGKASIYQINIENDYANKYVSFLLSKEAINSPALVKRWINEIKKLKSADMAILFGSVLRKQEPRDIDVLLVTDQKKFEKLKKEVDERNQINIKKLHPVFQSFEDVVNNIKKRDPVVLNAIKGIIVFGEDRFIEVYHDAVGSL